MSKKNKNNGYEDFNISSKQLILKRKSHTNAVTCLCLLEDGRLVTGSKDDNIIIYNKMTYEPDLIIKDHKDTINCLLKLSSNELVSCSSDKTIKIFKIQNNTYEVTQTLNEHKEKINKVIELKNKSLVSCSNDSSFIIYHKTTDEKYEKEFQIPANGWCQNVVQTKENEICFCEFQDDFYDVHFYDLNERKIKASIGEMNITGAEPFNMITENLLIIGGYNEIYIIDVNRHQLIRAIDVPDAGLIFGFCEIKEGMFLTGGEDSTIRQWKIEGENINLFSKKEEADESVISGLIQLGDGKIASLSGDESIKIWK